MAFRKAKGKPGADRSIRGFAERKSHQFMRTFLCFVCSLISIFFIGIRESALQISLCDKRNEVKNATHHAMVRS